MSDHFSPEQAATLLKCLHCRAEELFLFLQDSSAEVIRAALKNPACGEPHLLALLKRRDLQEELVRAICQHPVAQESHAVKVALAHHPATPGPQFLKVLHQLYLFELVTICHLPGATADMKVAAERLIVQRLPGTPLGNKLTLARRATAAVLEILVREGDPHLVGACLDNPHLKEGSLYQLLKGGAATAETIAMIARHPRWQGRPNLKQAILHNRQTPAACFSHLLPTLASSELKRLAASGLSAAQQQQVRQELRRRGL